MQLRWIGVALSHPFTTCLVVSAPVESWVPVFFALGKAGHLGRFGGCGRSGIYTFGKSCELVSMASNVHGGMSSKELSEMPAKGCGRTKICGWTLCI